ncbi:hypothetical protein ATANTOWER_012532 [Ataeniobius toweri]|uniref:Uncharacterized protein n=1 Tax=Ataeniobius toweri TaxID=208326 RepID=A0ABU7AQM8_9TELE|nr:hypothetical protein [Ataeniobius toweri]
MPSSFHLSLHAKCAKTMNENMTSKEVFTVYVTQFTVKEDQNSSHPRLVIAGILEVYTATHTHTHTPLTHPSSLVHTHRLQFRGQSKSHSEHQSLPDAASCLKIWSAA